MKNFKTLSVVFCSLIFVVNESRAQNIIWQEDFNSAGSSKMILNSTDLSSTDTIDNKWIINAEYEGPKNDTIDVECGSLPPPYNKAIIDLNKIPVNANQPSGIKNYPRSRYAHITSIITIPYGISNASYSPADLFCVPDQNYFIKMKDGISTLGKTNVRLKFWWFCGGFEDKEYGELYYRTNGGSSWIIIPSVVLWSQKDWKNEIVQLPEFNNVADLRFGWRFVNQSYFNLFGELPEDPALGIDDIEITEGGSSVIAPVAEFSVSPQPPICAGTCLNFTDASTNSPTGWTWTFNGAETNSSSSPNPINICFKIPGTYTVSLTASNAGGSSTPAKTLTVVVKDTVAVPDVHISGSTLTSDDAPNYQWYKYVGQNPVIIPGATNKIFSQTEAGVTYFVKVSSTDGCNDNQSAPILFTLGVNDITGFHGVKIYPSPVADQLTIENISFADSPLNIEIFNVVGKIIFGKNSIDSKLIIDMHNYSSGIYYVKVFNASDNATFRISKE